MTTTLDYDPAAKQADYTSRPEESISTGLTVIENALASTVDELHGVYSTLTGEPEPGISTCPSEREVANDLRGIGLCNKRIREIYSHIDNINRVVCELSKQTMRV